jgi:hypothetical protein
MLRTNQPSNFSFLSSSSSVATKNFSSPRGLRPHSERSVAPRIGRSDGHRGLTEPAKRRDQHPSRWFQSRNHKMGAARRRVGFACVQNPAGKFVTPRIAQTEPC